MRINLRRPFGLAAVLALVGTCLLAPLPAAATTHEENPCERLSAGEVRYSVRDAKRVTFATAVEYGSTETRLTSCVRKGGQYEQEWQSWGYSGRNGFAPAGSMWENTLYSPTGSFTFTEALGRRNPGTELKYYELNPASRWGGEHGATYNQYFEGTGGSADENLWRYMEQGLYEQAAVINWNRPPDMPTRQGASFAIFFHAGYAPTWGCISTELATVVRLLKTAVPGDRIVMGTVADVFTESTEASDAALAAAELAEEKADAANEKIASLTAGLLSVAVLVGGLLVLRKAFKRLGGPKVPALPPDRQGSGRPQTDSGQPQRRPGRAEPGTGQLGRDSLPVESWSRHQG